jgi:hypothetical protein
MSRHKYLVFAIFVIMTGMIAWVVSPQHQAASGKGSADGDILGRPSPAAAHFEKRTQTLNDAPNETARGKLPSLAAHFSSSVTEEFHVQVEKDGFQEALLDRFERQTREELKQMERMSPGRVHDTASEIAARLRDLHEVCSQPIPQVVGHVRVPPDSGLTYDQALTQMREANKKRSWLIDATGKHGEMVAQLDSLLSRLQRQGSISSDAVEEILRKARGK